jgi:hypothetical protein
MAHVPTIFVKLFFLDFKKIFNFFVQTMSAFSSLFKKYSVSSKNNKTVGFLSKKKNTIYDPNNLDQILVCRYLFILLPLFKTHTLYYIIYHQSYIQYVLER